MESVVWKLIRNHGGGFYVIDNNGFPVCKGSDKTKVIEKALSEAAYRGLEVFLSHWIEVENGIERLPMGG